MIEIEDIIRKIVILGIIVILSYTVYCIITNTNISFSSDSIRIEKNSEYPTTSNPIAFGVTGKDYIAEIKK